MSTKMKQAAIAAMVASVFVAVPAFAAEDTHFVQGELGYETHATPAQATRMQVRTQLAAAQQSGQVWYGEIAPPRAAGAAAGAKTRDQVRRDFEESRRNPVGADGTRYMFGELGWTR